MIETNHIFITTPAIEKIIAELNKAVERNEWVALFGDFGTGKTEIKNYLISQWEKRKERYAVVQFPMFRTKASRITKIMKHMLEVLTPDSHIPVDVELRAERLRTALMKAYQYRRKVILVIEDAGSINEQTFRELKKIHELTGLSQKNLFSILMFGNESNVTRYVLRGDEIGLRCRSLYMSELTDSEMITFAEKRFGVTFPKGREGQLVKAYFTRNIRRTPLAIKFVIERMRDLKNFNNEINMSVMIKAKVLEARIIKERISRYNITSTDIQNELARSGIKAADSTIRHVLNDRTENYKEDLVADILTAAERLIQKKEEVLNGKVANSQ